MRKLIFNGLAIGAIFINTIYIIIDRYEQNRVERTVTVQEGMGIVPTAMISIIVLVGLFYLISWLRGKVSQDKSGMFRIFTYGIILFALLFVSHMWVETIAIKANTNLEQFVTDLEYHAQTLKSLYLSIGIGILFIAINKLLDTDIPKKLWIYFTK